MRSSARARRIAFAAVGACLLVIIVIAIGSQVNESTNASQNTPQSSSDGPSVSASPSTPSATPTPLTAVPDVTAASPADARAALIRAGFVVLVQDDAGATVADPTGWTVERESETGAAIPYGSTVVLTLSAPIPPPAPAPQAPAPAAPAPEPAQPAAPGGGATALCNDGTLSYAAHHQGACSHHGGVAVFYK